MFYIYEFKVMSEILNSLEKLGIINQNPYKSAVDGICFDLLQLLIVIEKIKKSKGKQEALSELVRLYNLLKNTESIKGKLSEYFYTTNEADEIFSIVCNVLDRSSSSKNSFQVFLSEVNSNLALYNKGMNIGGDKTEFWLELVPNIITESDYQFNSLSPDSLGYSHFKLFYAYMNYNSIFEVIERLQVIDDANIIENTAKDYAYKMSVDLKALLKKVRTSLHIKHQLNQSICLAFSKKILQIIKPLRQGLNVDFVPYDNFFPEVRIEKEEFGNSFFESKNLQSVVIMKFSLKSFNQAKEAGNNKLINQAILNALWSKIENCSVMGKNTDESYFISAISDYSYWNDSQVYSLGNIEQSKGRKLTIPSMIRGLRFSYWLEEQRTKSEARINIRDAVVQYAESDSITDSATTIKFSFEAVKRVGKDELSPLLGKQLVWRLSNDIPSIQYAFNPLNDEFYQKIKATLDVLSLMIGKPVIPDTYEQLFKWITEIEESLEKKTEIDYLESEFSFEFSCDTELDFSNERNRIRKKLFQVIKYKEIISVLM